MHIMQCNWMGAGYQAVQKKIQHFSFLSLSVSVCVGIMQVGYTQIICLESLY